MTEQPPPGWYPNPEAPGLRWWDGERWTEHTYVEAAAPPPPPGSSPAPVFVPPQPPKQQTTWGGLEIVGVVGGFLVPVIGFVIGVIVLRRGKSVPGAVILGVAAFSLLLSIAFVGSIDFDTAD